MEFKTPQYKPEDGHMGSERPGWEEEGYGDSRIDQDPDILICQIKIWKPENPKDVQKVPSSKECKMVINEVESITVSSSFKNVISTASVIIPKGTIVKKVITTVNSDKDTEENDEAVATDLQKVSPTPSGDDKSSDSNDVEGTTVLPDYSMAGLIIETNVTGDPAVPSMFDIGDRIEIRCGYTNDDEVANKIDEKENHKCLNLVFSGYITGVSPTMPIELKCEDLAYVFKTISCPDVISKGNRKVSDFFGDKADPSIGNLLEGTGIELHPDVLQTDISVGQVNLTHHLTVYDILAEWSKCGLVCFMRKHHDGNGQYTFKLSIGRTYMSTTSTSTADSIMYKPEDEGAVEIYSDWDVAEDNLSVMRVARKFLVVDAKGWKNEKGKLSHCSVTVRINPDWDGKDVSNKYDFINDKDWTSERKNKRPKGSPRVVNKVVDLKSYTRIPYISPKPGISKEDLKKEAIQYLENYNPSGISGKLTIFGGRDIVPTSIIAFVDLRQPARMGFYLIDEVNTRFGTQGYRQEINLAYKIKNFENFKVIK